MFAASNAVVPLLPGEAPRRTKTGEQDDTVVIDSSSFPGVARLITSTVLAAKQAGSRHLFPLLTSARYLFWLRRAASSTGVSLFTCPRMLRHGGASECFHRNLRSLKELQLRGRWKSFESVKRYQKQGQLLSQIRRLSPSVLDDARNAEELNLCWF